MRGENGGGAFSFSLASFAGIFTLSWQKKGTSKAEM